MAWCLAPLHAAAWPRQPAHAARTWLCSMACKERRTSSKATLSGGQDTAVLQVQADESSAMSNCSMSARCILRVHLHGAAQAELALSMYCQCGQAAREHRATMYTVRLQTGSCNEEPSDSVSQCASGSLSVARRTAGQSGGARCTSNRYQCGSMLEIRSSYQPDLSEHQFPMFAPGACADGTGCCRTRPGSSAAERHARSEPPPAAQPAAAPASIANTSRHVVAGSAKTAGPVAASHGIRYETHTGENPLRR